MASKEADKIYKKAQSYVQASIIQFRLKADWESATPLYEQAAHMYKGIGDYKKAIECLERAAQGQEAQGSTWHAAKELEQAFNIAKDKKEWDLALDLAKQAAQMYTQSGKSSNGGQILAKAAQSIIQEKPDLAIDLYKSAIDSFEVEGKQAYSGDIYRNLTQAYVNQKDYNGAVSTIMQQAATFDEQQHHSLCKAYLGAIVVYLYGQDPEQAHNTYQDCLNIEQFSSSKEAFVVEELFNLYSEGEPKKVQDYIKKEYAFQSLDAMLARMAFKLPQGDLQKQAVIAKKVNGGAEAPNLLEQSKNQADDFT